MTMSIEDFIKHQKVSGALTLEDHQYLDLRDVEEIIKELRREPKLQKLKRLADAMYHAAIYLTTDASHLRKAMDEYHQFIINEL